MKTSALIDPTGCYRYRLLRVWEEALPRVCFCMLNPSTADASRDDQTIRRCLGYARRWGYGSLEVVNLFAFRATSPSDLFKAVDPVGSENDAQISAAVQAASLIVAAWGAHGSFRLRNRRVLPLLGGVKCLGATKAGHPKHPLRLRSDVDLLDYRLD